MGIGFSDDRHGYCYDGPAFFMALNIYTAAVFCYYAVRYGKSKPCAFTDILCCKKRVEDIIDFIIWYAGAVILEAYFYHAIGGHGCLYSNCTVSFIICYGIYRIIFAIYLLYLQPFYRQGC